jgi:hypothetical protein
MKKWLMAVLVLSPISAFAGTVLQTNVHCTTASGAAQMQNPKVLAETIQSNQTSHIQLSEYTLWPLKNGENKTLLIAKIGVQGTYAHLDLGNTASTSVFISLPLANGDVQNCVVLMTKEDGEDRFIFEY